MVHSSVFDFINQSSKIDLPSLDDLGKNHLASRKLIMHSLNFASFTVVFASSSRTYGTDTESPSFTASKQSDVASHSSSKSRKTMEMQWVSEEAKWKRAELDRQHQQNRIQQLYNQRNLMLDEIKSVSANR
jgi:UDP-glucose 4-epimerase